MRKNIIFSHIQKNIDFNQQSIITINNNVGLQLNQEQMFDLQHLKHSLLDALLQLSKQTRHHTLHTINNKLLILIIINIKNTNNSIK
jgi:hypothetical protein